MPDIVVLDGKVIGALASGTRRAILKKFIQAPYTVSELSRELGINKSAISKHLDKLADAGLITKMENGKEFIYYELTNKGKSIVGLNENAKLVILLSSAITAFNLGFLTLYVCYEKLQTPGEPANTFGIPMSPGSPGLVSPENILLLIIGIVAILVCLYLIRYTYKFIKTTGIE
jgi:DNA-binding transcriptional ArsR family regulator